MLRLSRYPACKACYHSRKPFVGLDYKQKMQAGQIRSAPDSPGESAHPIEKKPRLGREMQLHDMGQAPESADEGYTEPNNMVDTLLDALNSRNDVALQSRLLARQSQSHRPTEMVEQTPTQMEEETHVVVPPRATPGEAKKESKKAKKRKRHAPPEPYSTEDVIWRDVVSILGQQAVDRALADGTEWDSPYEFREEVELQVSSLSSSGEALALPLTPKNEKPWVVIVPFSLPGEKIRARVYRSSRLHSFADLLSVEEPNLEMRDDGRVKCKYFGQCAGCQYQMLSYETQLDLKRNVVVKAYKNFSDLPESSVPPILSTIASPLQYGYRTKITPHFEAPPKKFQKKAAAAGEEKPEWLKIGFNHIGKRHVMDIEECPIATPVLNEAYGPMRKNIQDKIHTYKRGVSLLLRDSIDTSASPPDSSSDAALAASVEKHVCITDHKATVRERVGDVLFEYPGGSFFQNNNSVLVPLTSYVHDAIFPPSTSSPLSPTERPTHLVDAYCGAGLFALTLAPHFDTVAGIELSADSIKFATRNAALNNIPEGKCTFRAGDAANIFAAVPEFPPEKTVLVIDPPRKGCDERFIEQLLEFRAKIVVYVSCNVHTQARDVGVIMKRTIGEPEGKRYVLESLRGFDLFPQTAHVESVAVLRLM